MSIPESVCFVFLILVSVVSIIEFFLLLNQKKKLDNQDKIRKKLFETSEIISKTNDENLIYSIVLDTLVELIPNATKGSILLYNKKDHKFHFKAIRGFNENLLDLYLDKEELNLYMLNKMKETVILANVYEYDRKNMKKETYEMLDSFDALNISCTISAPIYIDNGLIGLINIDSTKPNYIFTEKDLNLLNQTKVELELALKNALAQNKLQYLANFDELTGLINRRVLKKEYDNEIDRINNNKVSVCFVMIDLDDFKIINDTHGHLYGDMVLERFSSSLKSCVRKTDIVARFAGDEFVIIFKDIDFNMAEDKMEYISEKVMAEDFDGTTLSFSYGICEINANNIISFERALEIADVKMYESKKIKINN